MLRRIVVAGVSACALVLAFAHTQTAIAGWVDNDTGQSAQFYPRAVTDSDTFRGSDKNRFNLKGHNYVWDKVCGTWRDSDTGKEARFYPRAVTDSDTFRGSDKDRFNL